MRQATLFLTAATSLSIAMFLLPSRASGRDGDWTSVTGADGLQFRWHAANGTCDIDIRDLNENDKAYYKGSISYSTRSQNLDQNIPILKFYNGDDIETQHVFGGCERITDVMLKAR